MTTAMAALRELRLKSRGIVQIASILELAAIISIWLLTFNVDLIKASRSGAGMAVALYEETIVDAVRRLEEASRALEATPSSEDLTPFQDEVVSRQNALRDLQMSLHSARADYQLQLFQAVASPWSVVLLASAVVDLFQFILNGRTLIVSLLTLGPRLRATVAERDAARQARQSDDAKKNVLAEDYFIEFVERSQQMVKLAQGRPNALLFFGTVVSAIGIGIFVATIPGLLTPAPANSTPSEFWRSMIDLLPRLLMLAFVQVLAGFFLRQYRMSMEELRYYEAILRYRESQLLAYLMRIEPDADKGVAKEFSKELLNGHDFLNLSPGTNMILEAQRTEQNELKSVVDRLVDTVSSLKEQVTGNRGKPTEPEKPSGST